MGVIKTTGESKTGTDGQKVESWRKYVEMLEYVKIHEVVARKDIKKGEKIRVRCRVSVPKDIYNEIVADVMKNLGRRVVIPT